MTTNEAQKRITPASLGHALLDGINIFKIWPAFYRDGFDQGRTDKSPKSLMANYIAAGLLSVAIPVLAGFAASSIGFGIFIGGYMSLMTATVIGSFDRQLQRLGKKPVFSNPDRKRPEPEHVTPLHTQLCRIAKMVRLSLAFTAAAFKNQPKARSGTKPKNDKTPKP